MSKIIIPARITKAFIKEHEKDFYFVYAVTVHASIAIGQGAVGHYYTNCFGVPTKFRNCKSDSAAYFQDCQFDTLIKPSIDRAIMDIPRDRPIILFPKIGLGCADLPNSSPKSFEYLMEQLQKIATPTKLDYTFR